MHKYLRSIGFRSYNNDMLEKLYYNKKESPDNVLKAVSSDGSRYLEFHANVSMEMGIAFRGRLSRSKGFLLEYYFPYLRGTSLSSDEQIEVVRESDREGYHGMCDDLNLGVELIFFLQNMITYNDDNYVLQGKITNRIVQLGGLASDGVVLLPIKQTVKQLQRVRDKSAKRTKLMVAARSGDEWAMEKLAQTEMELFAYATKRAETEDLYSIVNTFFMPDGIESDKYSIMGIISAVKTVINSYTQEEVYIIKLTCNKIVFDVCINSKDLLGIPAVGRRLKAKIWMQGFVGEANKLH